MAMPGRRETLAALVIALAACATRAKLVTRWNVSKRADKCSARNEGDRYASVQPSPKPIECPAAARDSGELVVGALADGSCVIIPPGCESEACATKSTSCLVPEGGVQMWFIAQTPDGTCAAHRDFSAKSVSVPCPFAAIPYDTRITRSDAHARCLAEAQGQTSKEVPCPK
jgi:hypothetical protein